jgi:hypothetical protein
VEIKYIPGKNGKQYGPSHHPRWNWEYDIPALIAEPEES